MIAFCVTFVVVVIYFVPLSLLFLYCYCYHLVTRIKAIAVRHLLWIIPKSKSKYGGGEEKFWKIHTTKSAHHQQLRELCLTKIPTGLRSFHSSEISTNKFGGRANARAAKKTHAKENTREVKKKNELNWLYLPFGCGKSDIFVKWEGLWEEKERRRRSREQEWEIEKEKKIKSEWAKKGKSANEKAGRNNSIVEFHAVDFAPVFKWSKGYFR